MSKLTAKIELTVTTVVLKAQQQAVQHRACIKPNQHNMKSSKDRGHVNLPHVHQNTRTHGDTLESQVVVTEGDLIIASCKP